MKQKVEYKKTAIRMPLSMWNEISEVADRYGFTNNGLMVLAVGQYLETERKKQELQSPETIVNMMNNLNPEVLKIMGMKKGSEG